MLALVGAKEELAAWQSLLACVQSALTLLALLLAVWWFWSRRQLHPRANLLQGITHRRLTDTQTLIRITLQFKNEGVTLLKPRSGYVELCQVLPVPHFIADELKRDDPVGPGRLQLGWCQSSKRDLQLAGHEIEPGELESIHCDFVIDGNVRTIMVESHIGNTFKRKWRAPLLWVIGKFAKTRWKQHVEKMPTGTSIGWNASALYDIIPEQGDSGYVKTGRVAIASAG